MADYFGTRQFRAADRHSRFRVAMTAGALIGVLLLAAAAFVLSYAGIRETAISAGVSPAYAGLFPVILDAALAVACLAALGLRGAAWWMQAFAWLAVMILLAALAVVQALRAAGTSLPHKPAAAAMAAIPWLLLLLGFGLALSMLSNLQAGRALSPLSDRDNRGRTIRRPDPGEPAANYRTAGWRTVVDPGFEPDTPDVRLIPPPARPAGAEPGRSDTGPPAGSLQPGSGTAILLDLLACRPVRLPAL